MKVKELIALLRGFPENAEVEISKDKPVAAEHTAIVPHATSNIYIWYTRFNNIVNISNIKRN